MRQSGVRNRVRRDATARQQPQMAEGWRRMLSFERNCGDAVDRGWCSGEVSDGDRVWWYRRGWLTQTRERG